MTTIPLPYRRPPLSMNDRMHWAPKARLTAEVRQATYLAARAVKVKPLPAATVTLHYRPATRRTRDRSNLHATFKPCLDGLIDAGLCPDDSDDYIEDRIVIHAPIAGKPGALWLTIDPRETP